MTALDWSGYIGQPHAKQLLLTSAMASRKRRSLFPHTLLQGPYGTGKTTLAELVAKEMKLSPVIVQGGKLETAADLTSLVTNLRKSPFLFIDEVHAAKKTVLELLYEVMVPGETRSFFALRFPKITVMAATTNPGSLPLPFISRFPINLTLDQYTEEQLADIIQVHAGRNRVTAEAALALAQAAQGTPRIALNYLSIAYDIVDSVGRNQVTQDDVLMALTSLEVTPDGWTKIQCQYLDKLAFTFGGIASADTLASTFGYDRLSLNRIEGPLLSKGFVSITGRGRKITSLGEEFVRSSVTVA